MLRNLQIRSDQAASCSKLQLLLPSGKVEIAVTDNDVACDRSEQGSEDADQWLRE
jgi:hypothetical protein